MAIFLVDFPMKNGDFPWQNVCSPEGKAYVLGLFFREYPQKIWPNLYGTFTYLHQLDPEDLPLASETVVGL